MEFEIKGGAPKCKVCGKFPQVILSTGEYYCLPCLKATEDLLSDDGIGKICRQCHDWKLMTDFPVDRRGRHGRSPVCTMCHTGTGILTKDKGPEGFETLGDLLAGTPAIEVLK